MTDKEKVKEELGKDIKDMENLMYLCDICDEIFNAYGKGGVGAVSQLLREKIHAKKKKFDEAHKKLFNKMGISIGGTK